MVEYKVGARYTYPRALIKQSSIKRLPWDEKEPDIDIEFNYNAGYSFAPNLKEIPDHLVDMECTNI